jgi:hypothetical protein
MGKSDNRRTKKMRQRKRQLKLKIRQRLHADAVKRERKAA